MIPVHEPCLGEQELEYVSECVRTGWVSSAGKFIDEFEARWAAYCGRRYGVAVSSGTAALQVALACLDLAPGDEVILPTFTIISCALAVIYNRGTPVLVDADPRTWCMDVRQVEEKISRRTRAIMPVHIYGHPADMDPILRLAEKYGLAVIEDAAEAHGAEYKRGRDTAAPAWARCGEFGTLSCFSFYANKIVTTGEGGMVLTDDPRLAERVRSLRNLCFQPGRRFYHEGLGFNFRLSNMQAALGLAQLGRIGETISRKRSLARRYGRLLSDLDCLQLPAEEAWARNVYWVYGVVTAEQAGPDARQLARELTARGVESRPFFLGMHEQPVFRERGLFTHESYPVAEGLARRGLYLPSGVTLTDGQLARVSQAVHEALAVQRR